MNDYLNSTPKTLLELLIEVGIAWIFLNMAAFLANQPSTICVYSGLVVASCSVLFAGSRIFKFLTKKENE